jgi:hypothetical protein
MACRRGADSVELTVSESSSVTAAARRPFAALLLCATGASRGEAQAYADALHRSGAALVAFSLPTVPQLALGESFTGGVAPAAAAALARRADLPVLVVVLSDGGSMQYRMLRGALWGAADADGVSGAALAGLRGRVFGVVFDSAPSPNSAHNMAAGLATIMSRGRSWLFPLLVGPLLLATTLQMKALTDRQRDWPLPALSQRSPDVPHLFLIGEADPLTPPAHVDAVLAARRGALDGGGGAPAAAATSTANLAAPPSRVSVVRFPGASHLQNLELFPSAYGAAVAAFVAGCWREHDRRE